MFLAEKAADLAVQFLGLPGVEAAPDKFG